MLVLSQRTPRQQAAQLHRRKNNHNPERRDVLDLLKESPQHLYPRRLDLTTMSHCAMNLMTFQSHVQELYDDLHPPGSRTDLA